jgi:hypothetical protein
MQGVKRQGRESEHSPPTSDEDNCPLSFHTTRTIEEPLKEESSFISLLKIDGRDNPTENIDSKVIL